MSSFILQEVPEKGSWFSEVSDEQIAKCGVLFCRDTDAEDNTNLDRPDLIKVVHHIDGSGEGGGVPPERAFPHLKILYSHAFFGKKCSNDRLRPLLGIDAFIREILDPPLHQVLPQSKKIGGL